MSTHTLEDKLALLVDDIEKMGRKDKVLALLDFFRKELGLMEQTRYLSKRDLVAIYSRAINLMSFGAANLKLEGSTLGQDERLCRTYCLAEATYEFLRSKGFCSYILHLNPEKQEKSCEHFNVAKDADTFKCNDCGKTLKPLLWEELEPKS